MSVRTVRFNRQEESTLKAVLTYYHADFSRCVKDLFAEKLEDLRDIAYIQHLKESSKRANYLCAEDIEGLFARH